MKGKKQLNKRNETSVQGIVQGGQGGQILDSYLQDKRNQTTKQNSLTFLATKKVWGQKKTTGKDNILSMYINKGDAEVKDIDTLRNESRKLMLADKRNSSNIGSIISGSHMNNDRNEGS